MHAENWNVRNSIFRIGENPSVWLEVTSDTATGTHAHAYLTTYSPCWLGKGGVECRTHKTASERANVALPAPRATRRTSCRTSTSKGKTNFFCETWRAKSSPRLSNLAPIQRDGERFLASPSYRTEVVTELQNRGRQDSKFASKERRGHAVPRR